ncbi:MAG: response regulator [Candidatus Falkowbacteria bacterium]|nr:response regulator [Candidatus Falkowbacteria bacterium]
MKILIIDDNNDNLEAAKKLLTDHEVITANSYEAAEELLIGDDHFSRRKDSNVPVENFDLVITDLFMPASPTGLGDKSMAGQETPYGFVLALLCLRLGINKIAIMTDSNHHKNPISWALDNLGGNDSKPFKVNETTMLFASNLIIWDNQRCDQGLPFIKDYERALKLILNSK